MIFPQKCSKCGGLLDTGFMCIKCCHQEEPIQTNSGKSYWFYLPNDIAEKALEEK